MSLSKMISGSAIAAVISNPRLPDNPIVECNDAFIALTGYDRAEILGRNCRFMSGSGTEAALTETIRTGIRQKRPVIVEILNYKKDGTAFRNAVLVAPIFGADGELEYFLGSQMEVEAAKADKNERRSEAARSKVSALSPRQGQVLVAMAAGKLNKQIAYDLGLTERTVKMHRAAMLRALEVKSGAEAIRLAIEAGY
ncbi:LuxR C-terminal-related transcriptional regulator [Novosphingobium sp. P6W]|uniref:LuxR C-terminal-related transcriptional regulator n=1 Tax=Novosphingobium sp. P6W TaxID=1609758 RepID=UPI0005C3076F|nr:LuxR C-terminal-related transcriptional regulator [Novosphingobium sp. P6W]KIS30790.1 histidine kinase [Novosphingobium sp. P6W]